MTNTQGCLFCGSSTEAVSFSEELAICDDCAAKMRDLLEETRPETDDRPIGFEPVDYDYSPEDGELMYLSSRDQFYEIQLRVDDAEGETMIYLQPVPKDGPAIPITELADEIGQAIGSGSFYRVTSRPETFEASKLWWMTAMVLAPDPEGAAESSDSEESSGFQFGPP